MQLKQRSAVSRSLAMATVSLLSSVSSVLYAEEEGLDLELSQLYYREHERVTVNKMQLLATQQGEHDKSVDMEVVFDTMTGASPNGRVNLGNGAAGGSVPVTTASGFSFTTSGSTSDAQPQPWLSQFSDDRLGLSLTWKRPLQEQVTSTFGVSYSTENDYVARGVRAQFDKDTNQKRTRFTAGLSVDNDVVDPKGGIPEGRSPLWCVDATQIAYLGTFPLDCSQTGVRYLGANKVTNSYLFGVSQVWNEDTVFQLNIAGYLQDGYLGDPYKQVSIYNADFNKEAAIVFERRPSTRLSNAVMLKVAHVVNTTDSVNFSYRYFWDSWDVTSHTLELHLRRELLQSKYYQFHLRMNVQEAASFYKPYIEVNEPMPNYVSADHRVGEQMTLTAGVKVGKDLGSTGKIGLRLERINQIYQNSTLPDMVATLFQLFITAKF